MTPRFLGRYIAARVAQAVAVLIAAYTLTFVILDALPGNAVEAVTGGQSTDLTPQQLEALKVSFGLNRPVYAQWWLHLSQLFQGNLGRSYITGEPVSTLLADNLPSSAALIGAALLLAVVFGGGLALWATYSRNGWLRGLLLTLPSLGASVPTFWAGLMLLQVFSFDIHVFPGTGNEGIMSLVLPAVTMSVLPGALIASLLARGLDEALTAPYADTARSKGAAETRVQLRHALRNALTSTVTVAGVLVGQLLTSAVVVETVFSRPGLGNVTDSAVTNADIPVVQGMVVLGAAVFVVINLIVDLTYPLLDPRVVLAEPALLAGGGLITMSQIEEPLIDAMSLGAVYPYASADKDVPDPQVGRVRYIAGYLARRPGLAVAIGWVALVVFTAFLPSVVAPDSPLGVTVDIKAAPSWHHLFGTDEIGRDLFSRVAYGSQLTMRASLIAIAIGLVIGAPLGLLSGYVGGWLDSVLMRLVDVVLSIPALLLSLAVIIALGYGITNVAFAVGLAFVGASARVTRGEVLKIRQSPYVEAALVGGGRRGRVLFRHVLPNAVGPVLTLAAIEFGEAILAVASLSFLGFGVQPPAPEWGALVADGRDYLSSAWWLTTLPGLTIVATVLAANRISRAFGQVST